MSGFLFLEDEKHDDCRNCHQQKSKEERRAWKNERRIAVREIVKRIRHQRWTDNRRQANQTRQRSQQLALLIFRNL